VIVGAHHEQRGLRDQPDLLRDSGADERAQPARI
jgi:hypothetical protein